MPRFVKAQKQVQHITSLQSGFLGVPFFPEVIETATFDNL